MYPEILPIIRETIEFRYRLLPFLYSLFFETARTGEPIIRPMVYHFSHDPDCRSESFDFMLGDSLLVASVFEDGARSREIYLPRDEMWCNFYTGEWHRGGQTIIAQAPLERIPLFVRAGGIIPMGKSMRHFDEKPDDLRQIYIFAHPDQGRGIFNLIEDNGLSFGYRDGEYQEIQLVLESTSKIISISMHYSQMGFEIPYHEIEFILPPGDTRMVTSNLEIKSQGGLDTRQRIVISLDQGDESGWSP
jgi:alpha-glucosidase